MITDDYNAAMTEVRYQRLTASFVVGIFLCFITIPLWLWGWTGYQKRIREQMRARDLPITIKNAAPLIAAINRYKKEKSKFPATLDSLIPHYLERIPDAGPVATDGWQYSNNQDTDNDRSGGWELFVFVRDEYNSNIFFDFGDTFIYCPSGDYSEFGFEGVLVPFQNWGYYIE